ncbi:MAG: hypothetical protein L0I24_15580 [Pseudonocardia sp.]|nr:hypothetical protein [Pseudonocardia sp.]
MSAMPAIAAGESSVASTAACSGGSVNVPASWVTKPIAACWVSHSRTYRSWVPVASASSAGVTAPDSASFA